MKSVLSLLTILIFSSSLYAQLWLVDPLEAIYPDSNKVDNYKNSWKVDVPIGADANVHILIKTQEKSKISFTAIKNGKDISNQVFSQLIDVPVEQNTGVDSRTEQFLNKINPDVIRRAPFRIFEVIQPLVKNSVESTTNYTALRLSIPKGEIAFAGNYKVKINVNLNGTEQQATFHIKVHNVKLPKLSESNFFYTNWFNLGKMESYHNVERWSDSWFEMLHKYAELMAYGRQNSITIPQELIQYENGIISLDESKMIRYINVFRDQGFKYFEAPHLMNRGEGDDWGDPELKVALTKKRYYKEDGQKDVEVLMEQIYSFVKKYNLEESWLQHISDEPTAVNAKCYKDVAIQIKKIFPEIKIMEATNDRDNLAGAVDIWCPLINDFQENESFFRAREKQGEKILVYTCLIPGGKWLNRTLDMEKLRQVYFGWGAAYYDTNGYLHWGLNQYYGNPFKQSVVKHPSPVASANNYLPAGDTHVIYPGKKGPLSSIRFEAHRVGCEDYDLLQLLKRKDEKLYKKLIQNLFRSYTDYNLSITDYRKTKKKLLNAL